MRHRDCTRSVWQSPPLNGACPHLGGLRAPLQPDTQSSSRMNAPPATPMTPSPPRSHHPDPQPDALDGARARRGGARRQGTGTAPKAAAAKRRRMHVIEAARMYHALEDPPRKTQADIARELGRSPGYVSTLCRVGEAIRDLPSEDRDALRQPHVTYTAVATLVARQKGRRALLAALQALARQPPRRRSRSTLGGAASWHCAETPDPAAAPLDPLPAPRSPETVGRQSDTFTYTFDEAAWRADFDAALDGFDAHLRSLLDGVMRRARRVLGAERPLSLDPRPALPGRSRAESREAGLARLAALEVALRRAEEQARAVRRSHQAQLAAFDAERAAIGRASATTVVPRPAGSAVRVPVAGGTRGNEEPITSDDVEADLAD
jgi:hypothetical protein